MGVKGFTLVLLSPSSMMSADSDGLYILIPLFCEISDNVNVNLNVSWC